jgi:Family of unknown function (DUF6788)
LTIPAGISPAEHFSLAKLYPLVIRRIQLTADLSRLRQQLWRSHAAIQRLLQRLARSKPMVQGSFYWLQRRCGNPNCRCAQGELHGSWVITRKARGKGWTYVVPTEERGRLRQLTLEYRQYVRGRALLVKRQAQIVAMVDQMAELRLEVWPPGSQRPGGR